MNATAYFYIIFRIQFYFLLSRQSRSSAWHQLQQT
jgi:hypothetical protein